MGINATQISHEDAVIIKIDGRFDYRSSREFKTAFESITEIGTKVIVDLSTTNYMDSSALGMLLILREHLGGDGSRITIRGAGSTVRKILDIARFGDLFNIS